MKQMKWPSTEEQNLPLREDIRLLGDLLGETVREQAGLEVYQIIEKIRKLAKLVIAGDAPAMQELIDLLHGLPNEQFLPVTKSFSQFLNFSNIAEQYHRIRRSRLYKMQLELGPQVGSLEEMIPKLKSQGIANDKLLQAICELSIQLVLTSHPTEVKRRTIMRKYDRISTALQKLDSQILTPEEELAVKQDLRAEMTAVWQTAEVRTQKPTAVDEAKWGFAIIEGSLWHAVPMFMRDLDRVVQTELNQQLPLDFMPLKIDSWLGGDRDGNPNVTPEVTRRVTFMARWVVVDLLLAEIKKLRDSLSMQPCNAKLRAAAGDAKEPYRFMLKQIYKRLKATRTWARENFTQATQPTESIYFTTQELLEPLMLCYDSLVECKAQILANGRLLDVIRQLHCFGMSLVRTDIRQEASKHTELLAAITQQQALGDYAQWTEAERQQFLIAELEKPRQLISAAMYNIPEIQDTLQTFKSISELPRDGLGTYIISMASCPSDVLAVLVLQRAFGIKNFLPVVPLFETQQALLQAAEILQALFNIDIYRKLIDNYQQVMIGYSDSAKDVGMIAASWAQYCAQEAMLAVANKFAIKLIYFHGRGGSLGRGGWPTHEAILSQPPGTVQGVMRVTQQGEVIQNRFGLRCIALRTFAVYLTSTLVASLLPPEAPKLEWRELLNELSTVSAADYKQLVAAPAFLSYFQTATPTQELKKLAIGSRPDSRTNNNNLTKLRAIPWVFAWTQNRLLLPSWAGVGTALEYAYSSGRGAQVETMRQQWPFFHTMLSMCEMVLAKVDINVSKHYEQQLAAADLATLGDALRQQFAVTQKIVLQVLGQSRLLEHNSVLDRSIQLRNPYLLPLHLLQVELLSRARAMEGSADEEVIAALLVSIAGIAAGMRNTG